MRKILVILAATIVALLIAATVGLYWFLSGDGMRRALEQQATARLGQPVSIKAARAQMFPRPGIELSGIEVGEPVRVALSNVELSADLAPLLNRRIENARMVISESTIEMPLPFALSDKGASSDETPTPGDGIELVSIREISLRDVRIRSRGREVRVSADSSLDGNRLTLEQFTAESGSTSLEVEGEVDLEPRVDAKLRARANKVDLDELLALADAFTPEPSAAQHQPSSSPSSSRRIAVQISAGTATAAGVQATDFTAMMEVDGERVALSPMTFGLFGGSYEGSLNGTLGQTMALTLQSQLKSLDVAQLAAFGGSPDTVTGTLNGNGTFSARGADLSAVLAGATGKGSASIVNGTINRLNLVRTVVLFFGRPAPDTAEATDQFERMDASFSLAGRVFRAGSFFMHSRDADVTGSGTLALETGELDGTLDLVLSEELSAQAGTDLARFTREENKIVLPARLGGTLRQPRLTINAIAAIRRGIQNEVERRLKDLLGR
jgi:hypothetical protein